MYVFEAILYDIDGLVQGCSSSIANALDLRILALSTLGRVWAIASHSLLWNMISYSCPGCLPLASEPTYVISGGMCPKPY